MFGLTRYDPFFSELRNFDRLIDRFFREEGSPLALWRENRSLSLARCPSIDLIDEKDHFTVKVEVPGMTKDELDITVKGNLLTIKGETKKEATEEKKDYYSREIAYGGFSRSITLPEEVVSEKVNAKLKDGVLELTLPKVSIPAEQHVKVEAEA
jgi:HSP20 family protein